MITTEERKVLTDNELAKLLIWRQIEVTAYDGVNQACDNELTDKQANSIQSQLDKRENSLYTYLGMEKIFNKL